jgi:hypothetical protein
MKGIALHVIENKTTSSFGVHRYEKVADWKKERKSPL